MTLRIITFGTLSVRGDRGTLAGAAAQPRRLALLALLARAGDRGVTREKLTTLVWPDADDERSRRAITQAIYALRQELGSDEAILGVKELRLNPELVGSDVADFTSLLRAGRTEDGVREYAGPFLDGFHLLGNDEFARWVDEERSVLSQEFCEALEKLAVAADARGDYTASTRWWRRLTAKDPLNARYAIGVMNALVAAGDKHGALEHARLHETLLEQELDLPADRDVVGLAARIRRELRAGAREEAAQQAAETAVALADEPPPVPDLPDAVSSTPADTDAVAASVAAPTAASPAPEPSPALAPPPRRIEARVTPEPPASPGLIDAPGAKRPTRRRTALAVAIVGLVAIAAIVIRARGIPGVGRPIPVVAVGRITDYGLTSGQRYGLPLADLLSTNLARVPGMRVVSAARMLELMHLSSAGNDTSAAVVLAAARLAGATEIIDGTIYSRPGGLLRLDLRRVGVGTGDIIQAHTIEGADLFALVDSGTARLVAAHGGAPPGAIAGVTTKSVAAYSLYAQGQRSYADGDPVGARRLFAAALREDSTFAMAAFHYGRLAGNRTELVAGLARALRLSANVSERERLMIRAGWAWSMTARELSAVAESLVTLYPQETQGHLYEGVARIQSGDFLGAVAPLERAIAMDSLSFTRANNAASCDACTAMLQLVLTYMQADSLADAEREARRWTRLEPESATPWVSLWDVLERAGRFAEAEQVAARVAQIDRDAIGATDRTAIHAIRMGNFELADRVLRAAIQGGSIAAQMDALWDLNISLRFQGRIEEAVVVARRFRLLADQTEHISKGATPGVRPLAQSLYDAGHYRAAAALFDSSANWRAPEESVFGSARERAWDLAHAARSLAAAGDTGVLAARADTIEAVGAFSASGRDRGLAAHVRGLLLFARGDLTGAAAAFRQSIYSVPAGYTRENYDLARTLLLLRQPREAVAILQPVMRGKLDASNFYVTQTEVHELLAQAWEAAGNPDSASVHYAWVARAWEHGDPAYAKRAADARRRISPTVTRR